MTATGDKISYLNISDVQTNDGGLYQCEAVSKVGTASHSARLNVHGLPLIRPMEKKMIVAGGTLFVTCPFAGFPIESVTWERGKKNVLHTQGWIHEFSIRGKDIITFPARSVSRVFYSCLSSSAAY